MESLFSGNADQDVEMLQLYAFTLASGLQARRVKMDRPAARAVFSNIYHNFPYERGFETASIFKKAAAFSLLTAELRIFSAEIEDDEANTRFFNEIVAFNYPINCLWNATIFWRDGQKVVLDKPLVVSAHFLLDTLEFLSTARYRDHFACTALLFEALAYGENPHARYPESYPHG